MQGSFSLDQAQRDDIIRIVLSGDRQDWRKASKALAARVEASISAWSKSNDLRITPRDRNHLSALVALLTPSDRPKVGVIRARVSKLPTGIVRQIEGRIGQLILNDHRFLPLAFGLKKWAEKATQTDLIELLRGCLTVGGKTRQGRKRGNGNRSVPHLELLPYGQAQGLAADQKLRGGRPSNAQLQELVSFLAIDWLLSTGLQPNRGRGDKKPFGALVYMVFSWIDCENQAEYSLRRYWSQVAKPAPRKKTSANLS